MAPQPVRSMNTNAFSSQPPSRQNLRLQNTSKSGLGNGTGGWGGFGIPSSGNNVFAGLGGAPGLGGQGRPGHLSGFAQVIGGGSGQGPIDMSEFPTLSGGPQSQAQDANSASWNSNAIRQTSAQQQAQPQVAQQRAPSAAPSQRSVDQFDGQRLQQQPSDRPNGADDFPPLSGLGNSEAAGQTNGFAARSGSPDAQQPRLNGQQSSLPIRSTSSAFTQPPNNDQSQPRQTQSARTPSAPSGIKKYGEMTASEKWGLPGLLAVFEARRQLESGGQVDDSLPAASRSGVVTGQDLGSLGLDLDSPENLYSTFCAFQAVGSSGSTFDFHDRHAVPDFTVPGAYTVTNVPPLSSRMGAFSDETLFNIFYQQPRSVPQELAASELINRDWRWHKVLRQWLQKDTRDATVGSTLPLIDLTNGAPTGAQPIRKSERVEQGVYIFFDALNWRRERRFLDLDYESLDAGRVVAPASVPMVNGNGDGSGLPPGSSSSVAAGVGGLGRLSTGELGQQSGVGSSQIPSA